MIVALDVFPKPLRNEDVVPARNLTDKGSRNGKFEVPSKIDLGHLHFLFCGTLTASSNRLSFNRPLVLGGSSVHTVRPCFYRVIQKDCLL